MFKLEVHWIAGMVCMHGQKPLNEALGCRNVGLKVCIPSIAGLECSLGVHMTNTATIACYYVCTYVAQFIKCQNYNV